MTLHNNKANLTKNTNISTLFYVNKCSFAEILDISSNPTTTTRLKNLGIEIGEEVEFISKSLDNQTILIAKDNIPIAISKQIAQQIKVNEL